MDLSSLSDTELKARCYDELITLNRAQANIRLVEEELAKRSKPAPAK